tara:strand:- start:711 stop:935 length:225 start_codon:yes stop_codon:yes gene_type:complete
MRELTDIEIKELKILWLSIKTGRADTREDKSKAIIFWNSVAGTKFSNNTGCSSCLGAVFYGLEGLYKEYYTNKK